MGGRSSNQNDNRQLLLPILLLLFKGLWVRIYQSFSETPWVSSHSLPIPYIGLVFIINKQLRATETLKHLSVTVFNRWSLGRGASEHRNGVVRRWPTGNYLTCQTLMCLSESSQASPDCALSPLILGGGGDVLLIVKATQSWRAKQATPQTRGALFVFSHLLSWNRYSSRSFESLIKCHSWTIYWCLLVFVIDFYE